MLLILFFLTADTLPPLPEFSRVVFPEPPLWIEPVENSLMLKAYAGNFFGGSCDIDIHNFDLTAFYEQKHDWDSLKSGRVTASYSIPLPHLVIRPSIYGHLLYRNDTYELLSPTLDFSTIIPWAVIFGSVNADFWRINGLGYNENKARIEVIFDRTTYLPHFEIIGIYAGRKLKPDLTGKLHIRNLHVSIGSPLLYGFPSPKLEIQYLSPKFKIGTAIKAGKITKTLREYYNPDTPLKYRISIPDESLRVGVDLHAKLDFYDHCFGIHSSYKNWRDMLTAYNDYIIGTARDIQEINIVFTSKNHFALKSVDFSNVLHVHYNWSDTTILFLPMYAVLDTINFNYGYVEISAEAKYLSERNGINENLLPVLIINPTIGVRYDFLKVYLSVFNVIDEHEEIFDGYLLNRRQFAGGLQVNYRF